MPVPENVERNKLWYELNTRKKNRLGYRKIAQMFDMNETYSWTTVRDVVKNEKIKRGELSTKVKA